LQQFLYQKIGKKNPNDNMLIYDFFLFLFYHVVLGMHEFCLLVHSAYVLLPKDGVSWFRPFWGHKSLEKQQQQQQNVPSS
jgi:hypothetical protein